MIISLTLWSIGKLMRHFDVVTFDSRYDNRMRDMLSLGKRMQKWYRERERLETSDTDRASDGKRGRERVLVKRGAYILYLVMCD